MKIALVILLFISEAFVGQVHPNNITLQDMVNRSECIFVVKKEKPYTKIVEVELDSSGKFPPHQSPWYLYQVIEVLQNEPETKVVKGTKIEVRAAHDRTMLYLDMKYALEGISKSPILDYYQSRDSLIEKRDRYIVFLSWDEAEKTYAFVAGGAYEALASKSEIKSLIEKSSRPKPYVSPSP